MARAYVIGNGNSPWARLQLDLIALHVADLGGFDKLSVAELSLCRRIAALETTLEKLEGEMSLGLPVDLDLYGRLAGHLRRCLETIGIKRAPHDADLPQLTVRFVDP
jgi:hypothetical protein